MNQHKDQTYINALCKGDNLQIVQIYKNYANQVLNWVKNNNGNTQDAKDLFQEGIIAVYERYCGTDFKLTVPFGALLFRICKNIWFDKLRAKKQDERVRIVEKQRYNTESTSQDLLEIAENITTEHRRQLLMEQSFQQLSDRCQQVLTLIGKGVSGDEIALQLSMSNANAVYQARRKCGNRWRQLFEEQMAITIKR